MIGLDKSQKGKCSLYISSTFCLCSYLFTILLYSTKFSSYLFCYSLQALMYNKKMFLDFSVLEDYEIFKRLLFPFVLPIEECIKNKPFLGI